MLKSMALTLLLAGAAPAVVVPTDPLNAVTTEREAASYRMISIPTPPGVQFEAGAMQFLGPDAIACATRIGDIWVGRGVMGDTPAPQWTRFASGLHEVLGLAWRDGWLYATQRGEITRLKDDDGDGRADRAETFCDGWGMTNNYHEYAFGSKFDRQGHLWVVLCLTGSYSSDAPYRGWCVRVAPDGRMIPTCSGVRSPGGIGFNAEGDVFYTDNQGPWNGACKLQQLVPGKFVGHPGGNRWFDDPATRDTIAAAGLKKPAEPESGGRLLQQARKIPELLPPAVYFPYRRMGQSASGVVCDLTDGKFGPFGRQLFVGDQTHATVMRCDLEKIDGLYQGAAFPFRQAFDSGVLAMEFAPDGSMFVFTTERGWGARGGKSFSLQRLVYTGSVPFEIQSMRAAPDGFELAFTQPVEESAAADPAAYTMDTHTYIYQKEYGSPDVDQTKPKITRVVVSPDKLRVRLVVQGLVEGHVHELRLPGVKNAAGQGLVHPEAYYTLHRIPK
jgi:hypothetical protein